MAKFKGGTATIRSGGLKPFDDYILRKLPGGRYYRVILQTAEDRDAIRKMHQMGIERVDYHTLSSRMRQGKFAETLTATEFLKKFGE